MAYVGCFAFYAGEPDRELVINKPETKNFSAAILVGARNMMKHGWPHIMILPLSLKME